MTSVPIGLQLYTVRDDCERDFFGTLEEIAKIGYRWIEPFTFHGVEPEDLERVLKKLSLGVISSHVELDRLESDLEGVMRDHEILGCRSIVCPWLDEDRREGSDAFEKIGSILNGIGERLRARGFSLSYHNHDFEFAVSNPDGLQRILSQADPQNLSSQLDTYWVHFAGFDPVQYIRQLGPRLSSIHLKDQDPADGKFSPIGSGTLDMPSIIRASQELGVKAFIVEQDYHKLLPLQSVKKSLEFLRSQGLTE